MVPAAILRGAQESARTSGDGGACGIYVDVSIALKVTMHGGIRTALLVTFASLNPI
jgi:hypothetical protein